MLYKVACQNKFAKVATKQTYNALAKESHSSHSVAIHQTQLSERDLIDERMRLMYHNQPVG